MVILGIDPGIDKIGWGVIEEQMGKHTLIDFGCLDTDSKDTDETRLVQIHQFIQHLTQTFKPQVVAIESLYFAANSKTAFAVGQARGVIVLTVSIAGIPLVSFTPLQVKLSISGYGRADKNQIQQMVKSILKLSQIPKPDDAADGLAIALTFAFSHRIDAKIKNI